MLFQSDHRRKCIDGVWKFICILCVFLFSVSCRPWQEAKDVITLADSLDQTQHVIYDDTAALDGVIRTLDNPVGRLFYRNTLGKAYYYMGRNHSLSNRIPEAAECYIEADRLQIEEPIYRGRVNACMGYICAQNNSDSLALIFYERSNKAFKESGNEWYYAQSLLNIARYKIRIQCFEDAEKILEDAANYQLDSTYIARYYETLGVYYFYQNRYDTALLYFEKCVSHSRDVEMKSYSYLKMLQIYYLIGSDTSPLEYAQYIIKYSANPNFRTNAYYNLITYAERQNCIDLLAEYSHARENANRLLTDFSNQYAVATANIYNYLNKPYLFWLLEIFIVIVIFCILCASIIGASRIFAIKDKKRQREELFQVRTQLRYVMSEKSKELNRRMESIRNIYPSPPPTWNNYSVFRKSLDPYLYQWFYKLENEFNLSSREIIFCLYCILYPNCSLQQIAGYINYSPKGIRNYKQRIAKKLNISSLQLCDFLLNLL